MSGDREGENLYFPLPKYDVITQLSQILRITEVTCLNFRILNFRFWSDQANNVDGHGFLLEHSTQGLDE